MTGLWSLRVPYPTRKYWWRLLHNTGETQEQVLHLFRSVDTSMRAAASNVSRPGRAAAWKGEALISAFCLEIEIGGQHDHVANRHAAWPRQHERHHVRHFAGLQQTSRLSGFLQLLRRPVREQCADDGAGRD